LKIVGEIWPENSNFIKIWQDNGYFAWSAVYIYDSILVKYSTSKMRNVSDKLCRENRNILYSLTFSFSKIVPFMSNVEEYSWARGATDGSIT
jgi:hypothetical protein